MAIEIEKKYRLSEEDSRLIEKRLGEIGAEFCGEDFEENILYRGGPLKGRNAVLRIRKIGEKTVLTYKERIENDSPVKQQTEHETRIENCSEMEKIIECLGLSKKMIYEKRRRTWRLKQVEIVLDELPFGLFMEIEGPVTAIAEAEMLLDIEDFPAEHKTYPRLTGELGKDVAGVIEARFDQIFL